MLKAQPLDQDRSRTYPRDQLVSALEVLAPLQGVDSDCKSEVIEALFNQVEACRKLALQARLSLKYYRSVCGITLVSSEVSERIPKKEVKMLVTPQFGLKQTGVGKRR
jgi:hypothetical protein